VAAGVLVLLPATAFHAAVALAVTMIGAVAAHLFVIGGSPLLALVMLAVTGTIAWARRND
jgi:putative oxidoreductase